MWQEGAEKLSRRWKSGRPFPLRIYQRHHGSDQNGGEHRKQTWTQMFEDRVSGQSTCSPIDGVQPNAWWHGDRRWFGVDSSWRHGAVFSKHPQVGKLVADEPVISQAVIDRIRNGGDPKAFVGTSKEQLTAPYSRRARSHRNACTRFPTSSSMMVLCRKVATLVSSSTSIQSCDFVGVMFSNNHTLWFRWGKGCVDALLAKLLADK